MTREEAITYLKVIWNRYTAEYEIEAETKEAIDMAISALSATNDENLQNCGDLISRAEAIEAVRGLSVLVDDEDFPYFEGALNALPSADTPSVSAERVGEWHLMSEEGFPPTRYKKYLITTNNGTVSLAHISGFVGEERWSGRFRDCVVAWMELPKPYEAKMKGGTE